MNITVKPMETEEEILGKAYVHWRGWHDAYPGLISQEYLDRLTLEKCEETAHRWLTNILIAKDGDKVVGFAGYGTGEEDSVEIGEIFAMYVLSDYYGTGVGQKLMEAALEKLADFPKVCLWVLKDNKRAIRFYEKCGFAPNGEEMTLPTVQATEIRMVRERD